MEKSAENKTKEINGYAPLVFKTILQTFFAFFVCGIFIVSLIILSFPGLGYSLYQGTSNFHAQYFHAYRAYYKASSIFLSMEEGQKRSDYERETLMYYHVKALDAAIFSMDDAIKAKDADDILFYAEKVNRHAIEYTSGNQAASYMSASIDADAKLRATKSVHPQVTNYEGRVRAKRTQALYQLKKAGIKMGSSIYEDPYDYSYTNFLLYLALLYKDNSQSGFYENMYTFEEIAENPNLRIDISMAEYLNCLLTEIGRSTRSVGIYEQHVFDNIVNPASFTEQYFERHLDSLSRDMLIILEPYSIQPHHLLTALQLSRTMVLLTNCMREIYTSYNALQQRNNLPQADNVWTSRHTQWAENQKQLMERYLLIK